MSKCESSTGGMMLTGKSKHSECHFVHHEFQVDCPVIEPARYKANAWVMALGSEVKFTLEQAAKAHRGSRGIALLVP